MDEVERLLEAASRLSRDSPPREIDSLLRQIAAARLSNVAQRRVLDEIKRRTRIPISDMAAELRSAKAGLPENRRPGWTKQIAVNKYGEPCPIASNVLLALQNDRSWLGVLWYDEFHQQPWIRSRPPWANGDWRGERPFTDADEARTLVWVQNAGIHARQDQVRAALSVAIDDMKFHPVRDYLESLTWDGVSRLETAPTFYFGVEPISGYTDVVFMRWMISAVARIMRPGCAAKYCLILEGPQDIKKSTALEILGGAWFTDDVAALGSKDAAMQIGNAWIVELAELDSMSRAEVSTIKAFISRKVDRFRKPFGRYVVNQERQCVLAGTVNPAGTYFQDDTGNVRYWPMRCTAIDVEALRADRDQLWAEAVARYRQGETWWIEEPETVEIANLEQEKRTTEDVWQPIVDRYLKDVGLRGATGAASNFGTRWVTLHEVMAGGLNIETARMGKLEEKRAASCVRRAGWERYRDSVKDAAGIYTRPWRYRPIP